MTSGQGDVPPDLDGDSQPEAERLREEVQALSVQAHGYGLQVRALEERLERQAETIRSLEGQLRQMRRSITWRGTEPIRRAYAGVQRLRRADQPAGPSAATASQPAPPDEREALSDVRWTEERFLTIRPLAASPVTDIIICAGRDTVQIERCLEAIRRYTPAETYRLVLVTHEADAARLAQRAPGGSEIVTHTLEPFNFARANNLALARCAGDVVMLNDDTEVTAGWLQQLRADARGFALASARTGQGRSGNPETWGEGPAQLTRYPITMFCALIPQRLRQVVGRLDEEFAYYGGEDVDYSCRALLNGFPLIVSSAFVQHAGARSFGWQKEPLMEETFRMLAERYELRAPFDLAPVRPLVSLILPVNDDAAQLVSTAGSLLAGDYTEIEVIVVDDSASDETAAATRMLQEADPRVICLRLPKQVGPIRAQARGVAAARGQFVAFAAPGQLGYSNRILAPLQHVMAHPELDAVYCGFDVASDAGRQRAQTAPFDLGRYRDGQIDIAAGALLVRRQMAAELPFAALYGHAVEYDWIMRATRRGYHIGYCPDAVAEMRRERVAGSKDTEDLRDRERLMNGLRRS